ncbi:MAG: 3'-5' exonuclease [Cyanobacteria bacterium P01_C01_bin.89]
MDYDERYPTPQKLLILDFETTGLSPESDNIIELGAILYSVADRCVLQQFSSLLPVERNPAEKINRISVVASQNTPSSAGFQAMLVDWLQEAEYVVAHNADFDVQWLPKIEEIDPDLCKEQFWLCTYNDFVWPKNIKPESLIVTALNHGIGVSNAHRALIDCQLISALFDRVDSFEQILADAILHSFSPKLRTIAKVSKDKRDLAKKRGYRWDPGSRQWYSWMTKGRIERERKEAPFEIWVDESTQKSGRNTMPPPEHWEL